MHRVDRTVQTSGGDGALGATRTVVSKGTPVTENAQRWERWGTALRPGFEPIVIARKPPVGNTVRNVLAHGMGGINIDGARFAGDRWPANVTFDLGQADTLDVELSTNGSGEPLLDGPVREHLEAMLFAADPDVRVPDPDDPAGPPIYEGQASEAHAWIAPGVYGATGPDGQGAFRLVVGKVPVGIERTASAAFPPAEHDSTVMNEIARILEQHSDEPDRDPAVVLARINQAIVRTGRTGMLTSEPVGPPTLLERGVLLSELFAERERRLSPDPDDREPPTPGRGAPGRDL